MQKLAVALALLSIACGGSSAPSSPSTAAATPTPAPTPIPTLYDGNWLGITSQGYPLHLQVISNSVIRVVRGYSLRPGSRECFEVSTSCLDANQSCARLNAAAPISSSGTFTGTYGVPGVGTSFTISGQFRSTTSGDGDIAFALPDNPACPKPLSGTATWTVAKQ